MSLYDGFFDAVLDEETEEYDRSYDSGDFTEYFNQIIGSGVCIHNNPNSFLARLEDGAVVLSPGYLFIQGYWLKNDSDLTVPLTGTVASAIVAHLNKGRKMIEVEVRSVSQSYPDALVLGLVDPAAGTIVDTRYDTDICGVIDSAGGLSSKVQYAINYIDTQVESKLAQIEANVRAQEDVLDGKIADVESVVDQIAPPPVGAIKFSASTNMGAQWLKCDGRFVSGADYPELVALLRGFPGINIEKAPETLVEAGVTNGAVFGGYLWTFSPADGALYGFSEDETEVKKITVQYPSGYTVAGKTFTLSIVMQGTAAGLYILDNSSYFVATADNTWNTTSHHVRFSYLCFSNFSANLSNLSLEQKTIESESKSPFSSSQPYMSAKNNDYRPVVVFSSVPYAVLGTIVCASSEYIRSGMTATATFYAVSIPLLDSENTALYTKIGTGSYLGQGSSYQYFYNFRMPSNAQLYPAYSSENGGYVFLFPAFWSYTNGESKSTQINMLKGPDTEVLGRTSDGFVLENDSLGTLYNKFPVIGSDCVLLTYGFHSSDNTFSCQFVRPSAMELGTCSFTLNSFQSAAKFSAVAAIYIPGNDLWAFFCGTGILFSTDLSDSNQYLYYDIQDVLSGIRYDAYMEYDAYNRKLYVLGRDSTYILKVGVFDIPSGYNPINGANLPNLSVSGIPAYIKAKEDMPS